MNPDAHQRYLEDPEGNAAHLAECEDCRALSESLDAPAIPSSASSVVPNLPMAAWEGASYRSWPLVIAGIIAVTAVAALLFAAVGTSPLEIVRGKVPSTDVIASMVRLLGGAVQNAPVSLQVGLAVLFVIVNAIFYALLRRAPRGIDV